MAFDPREAGKVTVTVESTSGRKIELTCGSPDDAERLLRVCQDVLDD